MSPYYADEFVTLYHGDCLDLLPSLAGQYDAIVSDPPYGIAYKGGGGGKLIHSKRARKSETVEGDAKPFDPTPFLSCGNVALFGAQHYASTLPRGGTFHVWDKRGDYKPVHTADFDTVWINRKEPGRIFRCVWRGLCRETEHDQPILHPTQKPKMVMAWVLGMFPSARTILDPYAGSGTTLLVAKESGRRAIGVEIKERYCEVIATRLSQNVFDLGGVA